MCLFLVVGVPFLVLVTVPTVHADDSTVASGEEPTSEAIGTPDPSTGLTGATAAELQVLVATQAAPAQPGTDGLITEQPSGNDSLDSAHAAATDPTGGHQGAVGPPLTTPNLSLLLGEDPTGDRQRALRVTGDGVSDRQGSGDGPSPDLPAQPGRTRQPRWQLQVELAAGGLDGKPIGSGVAGSESTSTNASETDTASASLVIAPVGPADVADAAAGTLDELHLWNQVLAGAYQAA